MSESVIPGTYITVRSEGLISAGRIATGIVGVLGTASSGPVGVPVTLGSYGEARDTFGLPDDFAKPEDGSHPLSLSRAIQLLYGNGASSIVAVRVAGPSKSSATFALRDTSAHTVAVLTANSPGRGATRFRSRSKRPTRTARSRTRRSPAASTACTTARSSPRRRTASGSRAARRAARPTCRSSTSGSCAARPSRPRAESSSCRERRSSKSPA